jgi:hypothetical protein
MKVSLEVHLTFLSSRNRARGTLITNPISVTKEVYKKFIMEKVLLAIEDKWP